MTVAVDKSHLEKKKLWINIPKNIQISKLEYLDFFLLNNSLRLTKINYVNVEVVFMGNFLAIRPPGSLYLLQNT